METLPDRGDTLTTPIDVLYKKSMRKTIYGGIVRYKGFRAGIRAIGPCQMNRYRQILAVYVFVPQNFSSGGRTLKQK